MKNFNNRYMCKNIHRYFTDIYDISDISDISVKSNYRYICVYRYFDPWLQYTHVYCDWDAGKAEEACIAIQADCIVIGLRLA